MAELNPVADSYVRGGTYANTNYGTDASLQVKYATDASFTRESYLRFDLTALASSAPFTSANLILIVTLDRDVGNFVYLKYNG